MVDNSYMLLLLGGIFLFIGVWMWRRDREYYYTMEEKLKEKETSIFELYQALEEIMEEMERLYKFPPASSGKQLKEQPLENGREKMVLDLRDAGISEEEIAKRLDMGKGEVKLILDLKK